MARDLPIDVIREIERRWQRRLDTLAQAKPGKNDDRGMTRCPLCNAPLPAKSVIFGNVASRGDYICGGCGHAWSSKAQ